MKINLAEIYSEVSKSMEDESEEFKKIVKQIEAEALKGNYTLKINIDKEVKDWVEYPLLRGNQVKPDLIYKLEDHGLSFGSVQSIGFNNYTMLISWRK